MRRSQRPRVNTLPLKSVLGVRSCSFNRFGLLVILLIGLVPPILILNFDRRIVRAENKDAQGAFFSSAPALRATAAYTPPVYSGVKTWGGAGASVPATRVAIDDAGNIFVSGQFQRTVDFDPAHLHPNAIVTSNSNTVDAFLIKFDSNRNFLWVRTWGSGVGRDAASGVVVDSSGNAYVAGLYQGTVDFGSGFIFTSNAMPPLLYGPDNNIFVAKFNPSGATQCVHTWGGTTGGEGYSIAIDRANSAVYVQGDWSTYTNTIPVDFNQNDPAHPALRYNHGFYDAFLSKFDLNGNFVWNNTWGGHGYDDGTMVTVDNLGNVYVCGMYGSTDLDLNFDPEGGPAGLGHPHGGDPSTDWKYVNVFLSKFDSQGKFKWVRTWGGLNSDDACGSVLTDQAGNVYAGGRFNCTNCNFNGDPLGVPMMISTTGFHDGFISKYNASGTLQGVSIWSGTTYEAVTGLTLDKAGNIYATGWVWGTPNNPADPNFGLKYGYAHVAVMAPFGTTQWAKTWGVSGYQTYNTPAVFDSTGNIYLAGSFQNTVNFNTDGGTDNKTAAATGTNNFDSYLMKLVGQSVPDVSRLLYLPLVVR